MDLSFIDKIIMVFKYTFSSFLSIGLFIFCLLLFLVLCLNLQRKNKIIQTCVVGIYVGFLLGIVINYSFYVRTCINSFVKGIMNYIYFPSTIVYFFIILFVIVGLIYTIFSKKLTKLKRIINCSFFSLLCYFFMSFIVLASSDGVDLMDITTLYKNDVILSIVQLSNLILVIWIIFTIFYYLFRYFKRKYDN